LLCKSTVLLNKLMVLLNESISGWGGGGVSGKVGGLVDASIVFPNVPGPDQLS